MHHFKRMITVSTSLITSVLLSVSLAHATDVEVTPIPESEINYDLDDAKIDLSDIDAEDIANVQHHIRAMEEAEDPYTYFDGLSDLEQRSIIAAMDQGLVNIKTPDEVWGFELEQDDGDDDYYGDDDRDGDGDVDLDDYKLKRKMEAKEMALCVATVKSVPKCHWAAKEGKRIGAEMEAKYGGKGKRTLAGGPGDAHRHCTWSAYMRINLGEFAAEQVAKNHEIINLEQERIKSEKIPDEKKRKEYMDNAEAESDMDTFNNRQGRTVGQAYESPPDYEKADKMCEEWSKNGMLKTLHDGTEE